jgi:hypothetical protein
VSACGSSTDWVAIVGSGAGLHAVAVDSRGGPPSICESTLILRWSACGWSAGPSAACVASSSSMVRSKMVFSGLLGYSQRKYDPGSDGSVNAGVGSATFARGWDRVMRDFSTFKALNAEPSARHRTASLSQPGGRNDAESSTPACAGRRREGRPWNIR